MGNCFGSKSPTVRLQTGFPVAMSSRICPAILRISEPTRPRTRSESEASTREAFPKSSWVRMSLVMAGILYSGSMRNPMTKAVLIFLFLAAATAAILALAVRGQQRVHCEVCVTFHGATQCREAAGATTAEAQKTAHETACAVLASGMTDSISCQNVEPDSVRCDAPGNG